jgi:RNA polymerase sigma-70 factor (ECF subfamily)
VSDETEAFEALFVETRAALLGYLSRRAPVDDAADLLAEVYLVAWRRRGDLPTGDERRLWLFGAARRLLAEYHRITARRSDAEREACPAHELGSGGDGHDRGDAVRRALQTLGEVDRELITLTTWEGLTPAEAARVIGITAGTARVRLHRARARLARNPRMRALLTEPDADEVPSSVDAVPATG